MNLAASGCVILNHHRKSMSHSATILLLACATLAFAAGCNRGKAKDAIQPTSVPTNAAPSPAKPFVVGDVAFVRVKQYARLSGQPTMTDELGGRAYVLKNLNPEGLQTQIARPAKNEPTFYFGDTVTLLEKKDGTPTMWLVASGQKKAQIPQYLLTTRKSEIDFLKRTDRIPESMAFIVKDKDALKVWGVSLDGFRMNVLDSQGLALLDYPDGTSPFALKGNAVMFDESAAKETWQKPPVFGEGKKPFQLNANYVYYCVSDGDAPAFVAINLADLK